MHRGTNIWQNKKNTHANTHCECDEAVKSETRDTNEVLLLCDCNRLRSWKYGKYFIESSKTTQASLVNVVAEGRILNVAARIRSYNFNQMDAQIKSAIKIVSFIFRFGFFFHFSWKLTVWCVMVSGLVCDWWLVSRKNCSISAICSRLFVANDVYVR